MVSVGSCQRVELIRGPKSSQSWAKSWPKVGTKVGPKSIQSQARVNPKITPKVDPKSTQSRPKVGLNSKSKVRQLFDIRSSGQNCGWHRWLRVDESVLYSCRFEGGPVARARGPKRSKNLNYQSFLARSGPRTRPNQALTPICLSRDLCISVTCTSTCFFFLFTACHPKSLSLFIEEETRVLHCRLHKLCY